MSRSGRIDVIASALQSRMKVEEFGGPGPRILTTVRGRWDPLLDRRTAASDSNFEEKNLTMG